MKKLFSVSVVLFLLFSCVSNQSSIDLATEYYNVGNAFFDVDQQDKAEEYYDKVLDIDPNFHKARYNLIFIKVANSDFDSALEHIEYLKALDAENLKTKKLEAYIKYISGDVRESLALYLEVYNGGDISQDVQLNIIKLYYQLEEYQLAVGFISNLLFDDDDKSLYYMAGLTAQGAEDYDMAIKCYESYMDLGGDDIEILTNMIEIYKTNSNYDSQKAVLEILADDKDDEIAADALFDLATIYIVHDNNFSTGYEYLVDAVDSGFKSEDDANALLSEPDLIEIDKIRQLFIDNEILK